MKKIFLIGEYAIILILFASLNYGAILDDGLILYYKMDTPSNTTITNEVGTDGEIQSGSGFAWNKEDWRSGRTNNHNIECAMSDTTPIIFTKTTPFGGTKNATFCYYISILDNTAFSVILGQSDDIAFTINHNIFNDGFIKIKFDDTWYSMYADTVGLDHQVCIVQNESNWYYYHNGSLEWTALKATTSYGNFTLFNQRLAPNTCADDFKLDEVAVWNRSLTDGEVLEFFQLNGTYPFSSDVTPPNVTAINYTSDGGCDALRLVCNATDSTPTFNVTTDEASSGTINGTACTTTGGTSHICTQATAMGEGVSSLIFNFTDASGNSNYTTVTLNVSTASNPCDIPDSGEFTLTESCEYTTNQNKPNTKISITGGYTLALTNNAYLIADRIYKEDGSTLYMESGSYAYAD